MVAMIIFFVIVIIITGWLISAYNRLIALKGQTDNAWKLIDVQLKRRHDLIPNLMNAAKGAMQFEKQTLEAVINARNVAASAIVSATPETASKVGAAEGVLTAALGRFNAIVEAYPDLKATGNISQLQEELASTENKIAFTRQAYNDTATIYNISQSQFPALLVAGLASASKVELWEITDEADKAVPTVDLSMK
jgi:LemA protein